MPKIPTMPERTGGAGKGNLKNENISPTKTPIVSAVNISTITFLSC